MCALNICTYYIIVYHITISIASFDIRWTITYTRYSY